MVGGVQQGLVLVETFFTFCPHVFVVLQFWGLSEPLQL